VRGMGSMSKIRILMGVGVLCVCLAVVAAAWAAETLTVTAGFSPDKLGAPTNVHGTATIGTTEGQVLPSPIIGATVKGPAGLTVNTTGVGICNAAALQAKGPEGCPKDSKAGYGGGIGALELAKEIIEEPYTLNFFRGPNENGHLVLLTYLNAVSPVSVQLVLKAQIVQEAKPYGLGFTFVVPLIETLPEASDASAKSIFITLGAPNAAYLEKVKGKLKTIHVKGIVVPKKCPAGGFPYQTTLNFEDGTSNTVTGTIPCPGK
jgi:hypothetical protein